MKKKTKQLGAAFLAAAVVLSSALPAAVSAEENPQTKAGTGEWKFDFNIEGSETADGWTGITVNKKGGSSATGYTYSEDQGYGIVDTGAAVEGRTESVGNNPEFSIPEEVYTDFAILKGREFAVDVENGVYTVQFVIGSTNSNTTNVVIEDEYEGSLNPGKTQYGIMTIDNVEVTDGQMNMTFSGDGRVNGIIIGSVAAPENVKAQADLELMQVNLSWDAVDGAVSYNVYRNVGDVVQKIGSSDSTGYIDKDVELLGSYTYTVKAVSATGIESAASVEANVTVQDTSASAPSAPTGVEASVTEDATVITWEPVENAVEYEVYWSDRNRTDLEGTDGYALAGKTAETSYTYEKSTHINRWFKVVAVGAGGKSEASEAAAAGIGTVISAQAEYLDRGLVAVNTSEGVFVSFRIPGDEYAQGASYRILRDGEVIKEIGSDENSNYLDTEGTPESEYSVQAVIGGKVYEACDPVTPWSDQYMEVPLQKPEPYHDDKLTADYEYVPNDTNIADADGDGEYELFVKWDGLSHDNSEEGYTSPVYIDCYKLDGTLLWRIDLGINIRSGAHYTQFQVYDFDGDGKAEVICKTADGTVDGKGNPIDGTDEVVDYRSVIGETSSTGLTYKRDGYILDGPEYLTLFDGETGEALDTIDYDPGRGDVTAWGDDYGNRVDRFLAGVAYLDGETPSAIFGRGYYTRAVVCAYNVVDDKLEQIWKIDSNDEQSAGLYGQGAHSLTSADVDGDGCQEVIYGSATIDNDGTLLYSLSQKGDRHGGHGDAERVSDFNLKNPGLEIFMVHENHPWDAGMEMHDAETGDYQFALPTTDDTGRGATGDIDPRYEGAESWAVGTNTWNSRSGRLVSQDGELISETIPAANFMIWWDGDLGREILDHTYDDKPVSVNISKWNWETEKEEVLLESDEVYSNNGTKGNPCFQADIFGDWREEAAWRTADGNAIRIYTTTDLTGYRLYTLMHDTQYRTQVACEATGYNQPPTTSFYIGFDEDLMNVPVPTLDIVNNRQGEVVEEPEQPELNTDELKDAVSAAEGLDSSDYTAESWQALQEALAAAKDALANASAQEEIDAAFAALVGALEDLKPADGSGQTQDPSDTSDKDAQDKDTSKPDSGKAAQTGDDMSAIWSVLAVMAAAVLVSGGVLVYRRKRG